jgi:hypothetical protein
MVTIFKNVFSKEPVLITLETALNRIKIGKSKQRVLDIRLQIDKDRRNELKVNLPSVFFSGSFKGTESTDLLEHSNFIVLDFDDVTTNPDIELIEQAKQELIKNKYIYACWISPSGNGLKGLVKVADGNKHEEHFTALQEEFKGLDKSGKNVNRHCFESYDENIYINNASKVFTKTKKIESVIEVVKLESSSKVFQNILVWLSNKGDAFVKGERNFFIFKLASACCRFGINENEAYSLCKLSFANESSFSDRELLRTIKSAYKSNASSFGTAEFSNDVLIDKVSRKEIQTKEIDPDIYNVDIRPKDVIFGEDVKENALNLYRNGFEKLEGIGVDELDTYFKFKRGEISLLTGIGNYGKSSFLKWYLVMRILLHKEKFALFAPEDNPAEEFYHDMVEIILGMDCTPRNLNRPSENVYSDTYDFISKHLFYVYPKEIAPSPDYIKERFLELIIKEKISGCIIDPFNQMSNDYNSSGGRTDKYLETFLSDCSRFAQNNDVYFLIVAHPKLMKKDTTGSYPCPDVFDVADGAMWNNKMDNILVYHRPDHQTNPNSNICELHTKKIRRQKTVGKKGLINFALDRRTRRFYFGGKDYLAMFQQPKEEVKPLQPSTDFEQEVDNLYNDKDFPNQLDKDEF